MKWLARWLTKTMIDDGMMDEEEKGIYEYGIQVFLEMSMCLGTCLFVAFLFHIFLEITIFFLIFIPLRSYAGGLHFESFWSCYLFSCFTFIGVIAMAKYLEIPVTAGFIIVLILMLAMYLLYPVENINREVEADENKYFRKKLLQFLFFDVIIVMLFLVFDKKEYMQIVMLTFVVVVLTMLMGKCKNSREMQRYTKQE